MTHDETANFIAWATTNVTNRSAVSWHTALQYARLIQTIRGAVGDAPTAEVMRDYIRGKSANYASMLVAAWAKFRRYLEEKGEPVPPPFEPSSEMPPDVVLKALSRWADAIPLGANTVAALTWKDFTPDMGRVLKRPQGNGRTPAKLVDMDSRTMAALLVVREWAPPVEPDAPVFPRAPGTTLRRSVPQTAQALDRGRRLRHAEQDVVNEARAQAMRESERKRTAAMMERSTTPMPVGFMLGSAVDATDEVDEETMKREALIRELMSD